MSNSKEMKKRQVTLSLSLIELSNNAPWDIENYNEEGLFLVKTKDGLFHIVDVDLEGKSVNHCGMTPSFANQVVFDSAVISVRDEVRSMITSLAESIRGEFETSRKEFQSSILEVEKGLNEDKDTIIGKLETLLEDLKHSKTEDASKVAQGHISESALVEILRTIK